MANAHDLLMLQRAAMIGGKALPYDFIERVHFNGSSTCYIDTGFLANTTTTRFVGSFWFDTINVARGLVGSRITLSAAADACNVFILADGRMRLDWTVGGYGILIPVSVDTRYDVDIGRPISYVNSVRYESSSSSASSSVDQSSTFLIGSFINGSSPYTPILGWVGECWMYSNDLVVRHYMPCVRKSDNAVGFFEELSGGFITNEGFALTA